MTPEQLNTCDVCGATDTDEHPCECFVCGYCGEVSHNDTLTVSKDKKDEGMYCSAACAKEET